MSQTDKDEVQAFGCGVLLATGVILCATAVTVSMKYVSKTQAIKHGAAYYRPETGEFTWKDEVPE